jgi:hypothetical protein
MKHRHIALALSICPALLAACAPGYRHVVERSLPATDNLACSGYLVWNDEPVRDVFLVVNGSGILSNAFVHPTFERLINTDRVAYATFDKPGVRAPFGDPAAVRRDHALLDRYTLGHGVACAIDALRWAHAQFGPSVRLHVRGHSEGTLIALYAYDALLEHDTKTAGALKTIVLSGLALEPFDTIRARQLAVIPDGDELRKALASCDRDVLRKRLGISCTYVEDARRRPSGRTMFDRLAARAPGARFHVFQGTNDGNTPVEPVRALEAWNAAQGHLAMEFVYYGGAHTGSEAARAEMTRLLADIVAE